MSEAEHADTEADAAGSTKRALALVYVGYAFRYLYLLILIPFYGRVLGPAEYGRLIAAMSLFQLVWLLTEYGFTPIGVRDIVVRDPNVRAELFGRHLVGRLWMTGVGLVVGIGGTLLSPLLREVPIFGLLATLNGVVSGFNLGWYFQGTHRFRTSVALEVFGFAMNLPLILFLVRGPSDGWLVMASLLASSTICTLTAHGVALASLKRSAIRWTGAFALIRESTALFIQRGLAMALASASTYLISFFASASELGWYGAAERLISAGLSLMQPANQVLVSTVARHVATDEGGGERAFAVIRKALLAMTALGVVMLLGTELLGGLVIPLVLGTTFAESVPMLRTMALMFPFAAVNQVVTSYVLIPFRFERFVPIVSAASSVFTLAFIVGLGWAYGGNGVAWARVAGEIVMMAMTLVALRKTGLRLGLATPWSRASQPSEEATVRGQRRSSGLDAPSVPPNHGAQ